MRQLSARSRYLLFKHRDKWTISQVKRANLLFERFPLVKKAYTISLDSGIILQTCTSKEVAFKKLALWYNTVEDCGIESFKTVARSIQAHYLGILNFFNNRSTNASAGSFNAKIKAFRSTSRGVRDISFFAGTLPGLEGLVPPLSVGAVSLGRPGRAAWEEVNNQKTILMRWSFGYSIVAATDAVRPTLQGLTASRRPKYHRRLRAAPRRLGAPGLASPA